MEKSVGMFALGLWDMAERRLTLARDRFGEKPLYYDWVGQGARSAFVFGSELKWLRAFPGFDNAVDCGAVALFLRFSYVPTPYSIYENIFKLEPGTTLTLDAATFSRRKCESEAYWCFEDLALTGLAGSICDEREGLERLERALRKLWGFSSLPMCRSAPFSRVGSILRSWRRSCKRSRTGLCRPLPWASTTQGLTNLPMQPPWRATWPAPVPPSVSVFVRR